MKHSTETDFLSRSLYSSMTKKRLTIILIALAGLGLLMFGILKVIKNNNAKEDMFTDIPTIIEDAIPTTTERVYITERKPPPRPPNDLDGDGILDSDEETYGTSPVNGDTDKDGISDKDEIEKWHTDPTKKDTDDDGFADLIEIMNGYNPSGEGVLQQ